MIRHYYHVWADGAWEEPVYEHATALDLSGLDSDITIGVVGADWRRIAVMVAFGLADTASYIEADEGWEDVTLAALWDDAHDHPDDLFLYCHTKGAYHQSVSNTLWRQAMTARLVTDWHECVDLLREHDAVGCHWLDGGTREDPYMIFAGNFWWATGSYLATLPEPVAWHDRYEAERWVGRGQPRAYDRLPGNPSYGNALHINGTYPPWAVPRTAQDVAALSSTD